MSLIKYAALLFVMCAAAWATTLTGTLSNPDGSGANGTLSLSLSQQAALQSTGGCGGPAEIVPTYAVNITVSNGAMSGTPTVYGNDCMLPAGTWYNVRFVDNNGNVIFVDRWLITGSTINIGTIVSVVVSGTTSTLGGAAVLTSPPGTQVVTQPSSTQLQINNLQFTNTFSGPGLNYCNSTGCQFNGVVSMPNGFGNQSGSSAVIFIGGGNFYNRTFAGSDAPCSGVLDGWAGLRTDTKTYEMCIGSSVYQIPLVANASELTVNGTVVITSGLNLQNINQASFGSAATFNGGIVVPSSTNSTFYVGTNGNFFLRSYSGSDPSCSGIANGWIGLRVDTQALEYCAASTLYSVTPGGGGGGGSPVGPTDAVQYKASSTAFGGMSSFIYSPSSQQLQLVGLSSTVPALSISGTYAISDVGWAVNSTCVQFDCVNVTAGGVYGISLTSLNYTNIGSHSGAPSLTTGDTRNPGFMYWDTSVPGLEVWNGSAFVNIGAGSGSPGGSCVGSSPAVCSVQYVTAGPAFGGSTNFTYQENSSQHLLTVTGVSGTAGIAVADAWIQAQQGFVVTDTGLATPSRSWQVIDAVNGGFYGNSLAAITYINVGTSNGVPSSPCSSTAPPCAPTYGDTFPRAGDMYFDIGSGTPGLRVYTGSAWDTLGGSGSGANTSLSNLTGVAINTSLLPASNGTVNLGSGSLAWEYAYINATYYSLQTGSGTGALSFATANGDFEVDGQGNVTLAGSGVLVTRAATGAIGVTADTTWNSINTVGGVQASDGFWLNSTHQVINANGAYNAGTTQGVAARAFNPYTSGGAQDTGQDGTLGFNGTSLTWNGTAVSSVTFVGGVVVGAN